MTGDNHRPPYTPGTPDAWSIDDSIHVRVRRILAGDRIVAELTGMPHVVEADACLIAAAPQLLDLALRCEPWVTALERADIETGRRLEHSQFVIDLRAAIAIAKGAGSGT